ncbi:hypothetical protein V6N13_086268 [Hibiscus sabdariffa]|uniref:Uncharacterized protein n=1 Tax=Hibiscus sabdariffa TaxID=183260 RepID=A0ABR2FSP6_9ROSI
MKPHESIEEAVARAVREELGSMTVSIVPGSYKRKLEDRNSASYPGLPARYVLHSVDAWVEGLPEGDFVTEEKEEYEDLDGSMGLEKAVSVRKHFWKWVRSKFSKNNGYRLKYHCSSVKALAGCPLQSNLLASGVGRDDRTIMFWCTQTCACLNSTDTGPQLEKMAELTGHTSRILHMAQSPNGCTVASHVGDETRLWNVFGDAEVAKD